MKVLVVDDEPLARRRLLRKLRSVASVHEVFEAASGDEALRQLDALAPDVLLLDINMPGRDGLATARARPDMPAIIFVTAHSQHAVTAFELHAVDYLLKPVTAARLETALERARARRERERAPAPARDNEEDNEKDNDEDTRLRARTGDAVHIFAAQQLTRVFSRDKYSVFLHGGREWLLDESLNELERRLAPIGFLRVHRAELVNMGAVRSLEAGTGGARLELRDGQRAAVSRRQLAEVRRRLGLRR